jgi:hypothetical protein
MTLAIPTSAAEGGTLGELAASPRAGARVRREPRHHRRHRHQRPHHRRQRPAHTNPHNADISHPVRPPLRGSTRTAFEVQSASYRAATAGEKAGGTRRRGAANGAGAGRLTAASTVCEAAPRHAIARVWEVREDQGGGRWRWEWQRRQMGAGYLIRWWRYWRAGLMPPFIKILSSK